MSHTFQPRSRLDTGSRTRIVISVARSASEQRDCAGVKVFNAAPANVHARREIIMRWSFWPVSITLHVALAIAAFVVPLVADVAPPTPAPIHMFLPPTRTVPVPNTVIAQATRARTAPVLPNVVAPMVLAPESNSVTEPVGPVIPDLPPGSGLVDPSAIGGGGALTLVDV